MKKIYSLCVCVLLSSLVMMSCKSHTDYTHMPPRMRLDSLYTKYVGSTISSYQSYGFNADTLVTTVTIDYAGTTVELFYELNSEVNMEQLDVQLYGVNGAKFIRSDTTALNGNADLQWTSTSIRSGFKRPKHDEFQIMIPDIQQESSVVVLATDEKGYQHAYTIAIKFR